MRNQLLSVPNFLRYLLYCLIYIGVHTQNCLAVPQEGEWKRGPSLALGPDEEDVCIYHIPKGKTCVDFREQQGEIKEGIAKLKVTYVKADSEDSINHTVSKNRDFKRAGNFSAEIADIIPLVDFNMGHESHAQDRRKFAHRSHHKCAAIVLYGKTKPKRGIVHKKQVT